MVTRPAPGGIPALASEADFQRLVLRLARDLGWDDRGWERRVEEVEMYSRHSGDAAALEDASALAGLAFHPRFSVGSEAGWPDLVLLRRRDGRALFRELKTDRGRLTARQAAVIGLLRACGLDAGVWRPSMLDEIAEELR